MVSLIALAAMALTLKQQLFRAFDARGSRAAGDSALVLDLVLNGAIALVVVAAASTIGTLLVLALLIVPGAVARLATQPALVALPRRRRSSPPSASWLGLAAGFAVSVGAGVDLPAGATIVAVFVVGYAWCWPRLGGQPTVLVAHRPRPFGGATDATVAPAAVPRGRGADGLLRARAPRGRS